MYYYSSDTLSCEILQRIPSSLSVVIVNAATDISISPLIKSPTTPFHSPVSGSLENNGNVFKILQIEDSLYI